MVGARLSLVHIRVCVFIFVILLLVLINPHVYYYYKIVFIVLSLAAALLLPIKRLLEVKSCTYSPGLRDPALRGNRLALSVSHSIHQGIDHQF